MRNQKHLFNIDEGVHYLNCAYKSPLLRSAEVAGMEAMLKMRNPHLVTADDFFDEVVKVRQAFSQMIHCRPSQVVILPSVSYGMSSVLKNIHPTYDQHAITVESEFPSGYFSLKRWCDTHNTDLKIIHDDGDQMDWNDKIIQSINDQTSVVIISAIHWMNGYIFDLIRIGERCRAVGAKLIVDGSQTVGALPMNMQKMPVDALISAGYKWLFGPYSICLGYIGEVFNQGEPLEEAWMNRTYARDFSRLTDYDPQYNPDAGRYNAGQASHLITMPMLQAALNQILNWGVSEIQSYSRALIRPLLEHLNIHESENRASHLFSLPLPAHIDEVKLSDNLKENNIYLSKRGASLRVSVNVFNTEEDILALIDVIKKSVS